MKGFGLLLVIAIANHGIPEGAEVALLRANGASPNSDFWCAALASLPQSIVAVSAFLFISVAPLPPASLGFPGPD